MRKIILKLFFLFSFFIIQSGYAEQQQFCSVYDPKITRMTAIEDGNTIYIGMPKKLDAQKDKIELNVVNNYEAPCTLTDKKLCEERHNQKINIAPKLVYADVQVKGDKWMKMAAAEALKSVQHGGGPFGVVILQIDDKTGKVLRYWANHNHVAEWNDPTAHAEITTIRTAARELGVLDLGHISNRQSKLPQPSEWSHCVMYSSAEPCPMCLSATYWAGIKELIFGATRFDAAEKGVNFSDKMIYDELARPLAQRKHMHIAHAKIDNSLDAFNYYKRNDVARYGASKEG